MNEEDTTVSKFTFDEKSIYAKINWLNTDTIVFKIKLYADDMTWSGSFCKKFAEECRNDVQEDENVYYRNVKLCLSCPSDDFVYEFEVSKNTATLKWKRYFKGSSAKFVHGYVNLDKDVDTESTNVLIDYLVTENTLQKEKIVNYEQKTKEMSLEIDRLKEELSKFVDIKIAMEDCLYGKFVSILNTKKSRIQFLENQLKKYENV